MKFNITITFSKIMALIITLAAVIIELKSETSGTIFMFALPFIVALITGKQLIDKNKKS